MNIPLYKIKQEYFSAINDLLEQENEIDYQSISDTLSAIQDEFKEKVINISAYIKNLEVELQLMKEYEESMRNRRQNIQKRCDSISRYLKENLLEAGIKKVNGIEFSVTVCQSNPSIKIEKESTIPDEYLIKKEIITVNKNKIKEDLASGIDIKFATLKEGFYLKIK